MNKADKNHWIILLLEDTEADFVHIRDAIYDIEDYQITLHWMHLAREAINSLCEGDYDAALVDQWVEWRSGVEIIDEAYGRCTNTPMVLMVCMAAPGLEEDAFAKGAAAVVLKDELTCQVLHDTLKDVICRKPLR